MARRIRDSARRDVDRDYPHQVEVSIPRDGLAPSHIGWMDRWCLESCRHRFTMPSALQGEGRRHILRWCFVNPADADEFQRQFGGERITLPP